MRGFPECKARYEKNLSDGKVCALVWCFGACGTANNIMSLFIVIDEILYSILYIYCLCLYGENHLWAPLLLII